MDRMFVAGGIVAAFLIAIWIIREFLLTPRPGQRQGPLRMRIAPGNRAMVHCEHPRCLEWVDVAEENRCVGCDGVFCPDHLISGTWDNKGQRGICRECRADQREPNPW